MRGKLHLVIAHVDIEHAKVEEESPRKRRRHVAEAQGQRFNHGFCARNGKCRGFLVICAYGGGTSSFASELFQKQVTTRSSKSAAMAAVRGGFMLTLRQLRGQLQVRPLLSAI